MLPLLVARSGAIKRWAAPVVDCGTPAHGWAGVARCRLVGERPGWLAGRQRSKDRDRIGGRRVVGVEEEDGILISHVSIWEIASKHALARSDMPLSAAQAIQWAQECGFELLPLDLPHLLTLEQLHWRWH
jgi:hypothetical protein